jgi:hypothetical protein
MHNPYFPPGLLKILFYTEVGVKCQCAPEGRLGVRQLAAAFSLIPVCTRTAKAATSCRTPRASPPQYNYAVLGKTQVLSGVVY